MSRPGSDSLWSGPLLEFRTHVAAATATPGGGAVAAVTATFAAALLRMVGSIRVRRAPDAKLSAMIAEIEICEAKLARCADEDVRALDAYMAARKNTSTEQLRSLLIACAVVPLEAAEQVEKLRWLATEIAEKCPAFLGSDIATARHLLDASGAALLANVSINCDALEACEEKLALQHRLDRLVAR